MAQTTLKPTAKPNASKKRPKPDSDDEQDSQEARLNLDGSNLSMTPPSAKKQKKAPAAKKTGAKPLQENENESLNLDGANDPKPKKSSKSTDQYQKVSISVISEYPRADSNQSCSSLNLNISLSALIPILVL